MKEHPILFSAPMIKAILAGQKTVTRRVCKVQPIEDDGLWNVFYPWGEGGHGIYKTESEMRDEFDRLMFAHNPYGTVGDRLWVRETWRTDTREGDCCSGIRFRADDAFVEIKNSREGADLWVEAHDNGKHGVDWRPSIFMRPWMCRIRLEITDVRIEQLQSITEEQAKAEGAAHRISPGGDLAGAFDGIDTPIGYRNHFRDLWDGINGKKAPWKDNPWVWVVAFKRVEASNG